MKKILCFLFLALSVIETNGQTGKSCAIFDQNRDISGMREILMRDGIYYQNLRNAYAEAINHSVGKKIVSSTKSGMEEILDNTILLDADFVVPSEYYNGVREGNNIIFTTLTGQPSDNWAAYRYYEGEDIVYAKGSCMNPQKVKIPHFLLEEKSVKQQAATSTFSAPLSVKEMVMAPINYQEPASVFIPLVKNKFNWTPVIIVGGVAVSVGIGMLIYALLNPDPGHDDLGGPVGAPGHDDGGPVGAPGHDDGGGPVGVGP